MRLTRNIKAISKLLLILLLLIALIIGAVLSYLGVIGYYLTLDRVNPEDITVNITDYAFDNQNTSYFNVTIQCPTSYKSREPANLTRITVSTEDNILHNVTGTEPPLSYKFQKKGESQTFKCLWNWANYTGETIKIIAFVAEGSGPTFEAKAPLVDLGITEILFDSAISITHFNMTVGNSPSSVTYVNITGVSIDREPIPPENLSISLPHVLNPDESVSLKCMWNWVDYQNKSVTVAVYTIQGYMAYYSETTPPPVTLEISEVVFDITDTNPYFNITVQNSEFSPTYVNVTKISVTVENGFSLNVTEITPSLPYGLSSNESQVFTCFCNWTGYRNKNFTIGVHTLQGFTKYHPKVTPAPVMLEVTAIQFSLINTTRLNVTVANSRISFENANITHITVTLKNGIPVNLTEITPSLPYLLHVNESKTFTCTWNWIAYGGMNATFTAYTLEGYSANATKLVPEPVIVITDVVFNPADPTHFNVTVKNPPLSPINATVTNITVTVDGIPENITETNPLLPWEFSYTEVTFTCSWNWTNHLGKNVTVTVLTLPGYATSYTQNIPIIALIRITNVTFNITDTNPYFNVTILNPTNLTYAHLTDITVTLGDGTVQSVTVVGPPYLPHILHPNQTVTFMCLWDWTIHSGETVVIKVKTLEGYEAHYTIILS